MKGRVSAGRLLPEQEYVPSPLQAGEQAHAAVTQFPFEQTGRPIDAAAPAASRQDVRQGNQENNPLEALMAEGRRMLLFYGVWCDTLTVFSKCALLEICDTLMCQLAA